MDPFGSTQLLDDETPSNNHKDEIQVGILKIGSESHAIRKGFNRIGRSPLCRVILNDPTVSKVHAEIQAGAETAFLSDLRSSNGTKIKNVPLKPFFYYSINNGDDIYFGQIKAVYSTLGTTQPDDVLVPETPVPTKNRNGSEKCSPGIGNISESFLSNSSVYESDISMIPATQESEKNRRIFQKPSTPIGRQQNSSSSTKIIKTANIPKNDDDVQTTDLHEMETQNDVDVSFRPPAPKRLRLQKPHQNSPDKTNIHEAETQVMPSLIAKRKEPERPKIQDNIFEAETQVIPITISQQKDFEKRQNQDNIFEAETQVIPARITQEKDSKKQENRDNIFEAETQVIPVTISQQKDSKEQENRENIFNLETQEMEISMPKSNENEGKCQQKNILNVETRVMEISRQKPKEKEGKRLEKNIYDADTQIVQFTIAESSEPKKGEIPENIYEMATQILSVPAEKADKNSIPGCSDSRLNDTAESSIRSNSSRDRLRLSSTPPSSPENVDENFDDFRQSQNLLEIAETPLLVYEKNDAKKASRDVKKSGDEEEKNVGEIKYKARRKVQTIPDSSESETDDEKFTKKVSRKFHSFKPSNVIEDSSDEPTDEENIFGGSPTRGEKRDEVLPKNIEGTAEKKGPLEVNKARSSPLRLRRKEQFLPEKIQGSASGKEQKTGGSILGDSPASISRKNEILPTKNQGETSEKEQSGENIFEDSPASISRKNDQILPTKIQGEASGKGQSNVFGDSPTILSRTDDLSPKKIVEKTPKIQKTIANKFGASPLRLSLKRAEVMPRKMEGEASTELQSNSNISGDSPKKIDPPIKIQEATSTKRQAKSNIFGRSPLRLSRKSDENSSKKIEEKKSNEQENDIFEAATQRVNYAAVREDDKSKELITDDDTDIDLLPTQILEIPSSTPLSRRPKSRKNVTRIEFDGDDLHSAPTQILKEKSPQRENFDADIVDKIVEKNREIDKEKSIDLDDSLAINLGNLLGEEANNDNFQEEMSQMMTQNLVDILRPTQSFTEAETRNRKSSPRTSEYFLGGETSPMRKKIYAPGTLGFVDGKAKNSSKELVSADSSPIKVAREEEQNEARAAKADEPEASAACLDEDDIFFGLPEVKIGGTLSYPGSPASTSSSENDFPHFVQSSKKTGGKLVKGSALNVGSPSKLSESLDHDSPITPLKSRVTRREVSRYRITDDALEDSEDEFDYQDLKRMADRLLESSSSPEAKSRRRKQPEVDEKIIKISVPPRRRLNVRKSAVATKKVVSPNRRTAKLSREPSSLLVSDARSESSVAESVKSVESLTEPRKSSRQRKPAKSGVSLPRTVAKQEVGKESQEIERILGSTSDENRPMISRKGYGRLQLTRPAANADDNEKNPEIFQRPKVTRKRKSMSAITKETSPPTASPAKSRIRRTIAEAPGIPGSNEEVHKILFTGVKDDDYYKIVTKLGGTVVSDPSKATVLITDKVRRTFKFLCAVAQGIRVVSINWLLESNKSSRFLNCDNFTLKEPAAEAKYKFKLEKSLRMARTKKFLNGYKIIVTPKVNQPEIHEMKGMVEACGGKLLVRPGRNWDAKTVIISREEDFAVAKSYLAKAPKNLNITVQSTEFILTGILRQEINLVDHKLNFA